jgi:hypothetical protein
VGKAEPIREAGSYQLSIYLPETFTTNGIRIGGKELEAVAVEFKAPGPNWRVFLSGLAWLLVALLLLLASLFAIYEWALPDAERQKIIEKISKSQLPWLPKLGLKLWMGRLRKD